MSETNFGKRTIYVVALLCLMVPLVAWGVVATLSRVNNAPYTWLPPTFQARAEYDSFISSFKTLESLTVTWPGCTLQDDRLTKFSAILASNEQVSADERISDFVTNVVTVDGLVHMLAADRRDITLRQIEKQLHGRLKGTLIGPDGKTTCVLVILTLEGSEKPTRSIAAIQHAGKKVGLSEQEIRITGTPIDGVAINVANSEAMIYFALPSMLLSVLICRFCLRSTLLTILVGLVSAFGAAMVLALVSAIGATMNAILMVMAPLIFVLTISGGVHLVNYFHDEVRAHGPQGATRRAIAIGWYPCTLAATTTGIGLASLTVSNVSPVWFFGLLSTVGILVTLILLLMVLPGAMQRIELFSSRRDDRIVEKPALVVAEHRLSKSFTSFYHRYWALLTIVFMGLVFFAAAGLPRLTTSVAVTDLLHPKSKLVQDYSWMEENLGSLIPIELMVRFDPKCTLDLLERVELIRDIEMHVQNDIGVFVDPSPEAKGAIQYVTPGGQASGEDGPKPGDRLVDVNYDDLNVELVVRRPGEEEDRHFTYHRDRIGTFSAYTFVPDISRSHGFLQQSRRVVMRVNLEKQVPFFEKAGLLREDDEGEVWRITTRAPALGNVNYGRYINDLKSRVDYFLHVIQGHHHDVHVTYTGLTPVIYQVQQALLADLMKSFMATSILVLVVMILVLRNIPGGVLIMLPNLFPAVVLFGMMAWLRQPVDIGTMMTASVAFGIAVDDTLHFLMWFRRELDAGNPPKTAVQKTLQHCAKAMIQTTAICGIGMFILAFCEFVPTQRFGMMMAALLVLALVGDLILLPAMLVGPFGRLFVRTPIAAPVVEAPQEAAKVETEQVA